MAKTSVQPQPQPERVDWRAEFIRTFKKLLYTRQPWEVWADFVQMAATSIANTVEPRPTIKEAREAQYMQLIGKYKREEQLLMPELMNCLVQALEQNPWQDFLGRMYMELELANHWKGQFFTPDSVCRMMAELQMGDVAALVAEKGWISVSDPACGAGATLIAAASVAENQLTKEKLNWQNHLLFVGQDVDAVTGLMCYIQLSLLGAAGYVKIGNTLIEPISTGDTQVERYWYTPIYFSDVWHWRRVFHSLGKMDSGTRGPDAEQNAKNRNESPDIANEPAKIVNTRPENVIQLRLFENEEPQARADVDNPFDLDRLMGM